MIEITIPGEPHAQTRGRAAVVKGHARVFEAAKSYNWKGAAQVHMRQAMRDLQPFTGPVSMTIDAVFSCPKSRHRKTTPRAREYHTGNKDADNIAKAVMDAGSGVLYLDDRQVVELQVRKVVGAQGEPARVEVGVVELDALALPATTRLAAAPRYTGEGVA